MKKSSPNEAPSRGRIILYSIAALFCLCGLADATYLTVLALTGETAACGGQTGCFEVLGSAYAKIAGIPVAAFGVAGYFTAFTLAVFAAFDYAERKFSRRSARFATTLWLSCPGVPAPCLCRSPLLGCYHFPVNGAGARACAATSRN